MIFDGKNYLPILFQTEMLAAILDGRKTQTRRLHDKPKYKVGDRLWVREKWGLRFEGENEYIEYADGKKRRIWLDYNLSPKAMIGKGFMPSIHLKFGHHRIELEVTEVRQERLQDISYIDAISEGVEPVGRYWRNYLNKHTVATPDYSFRTLWEKINGEDSWYQNPLVYVYTFKRITP